MSTESALAELRGWYEGMSVAALLRERDLLDAELERGTRGEKAFIRAQRDVLTASIAARTGRPAPPDA